MNLIKKFHKLYLNYFWTKKEKRLFGFFGKQEYKSNDAQKELVLVQCVEDIFYYSLFGQIVTDIRKEKNINVEQYILRNFSVDSYKNVKKFLKSKLYFNRFMDRKWTRLYGTYCDKVAYSNEESTGLFSDLKLFLQARKISNNLTSKQELVGLRVDGIIIGDLVYDTYLRFKPAPTVELGDFFLTIVIWKALRNIKIAKKYFDKNIPDVLLQSYSTYIQHGITARVALIYGTKVYTFGSYQFPVKKLALDDYNHVANSSNYKTDFEFLPNKDLKLKEAELALVERFNGVIDKATSYMKESAYKVVESNIPDVEDAVIVFLHDFYDSPHVYNSMIFPDFLEWIEFTITKLEKNNIKYFLKPHPNQLPDSDVVVKKLRKKYPHVQMISSKITNKQLVDAGIQAGITVYGTIAHELAYMGISILTCGNNPHSSYDFCFEAITKQEYIDYIKSIHTLKYNDLNAVKKEVLSFYYMHNLNITKDDKIFNELVNNLRVACGIMDINNKTYIKYLNEIHNNNSYIKFVAQL